MHRSENNVQTIEVSSSFTAEKCPGMIFESSKIWVFWLYETNVSIKIAKLLDQDLR